VSGYVFNARAAPAPSMTMPVTRGHASGIFSRPKKPNRSTIAAVARLPAARIPIVAVVPILGAAKPDGLPRRVGVTAEALARGY